MIVSPTLNSATDLSLYSPVGEDGCALFSCALAATVGSSTDWPMPDLNRQKPPAAKQSKAEQTVRKQQRKQ
ncbi:hypothetical protein [Gimesia maris]|uniref:hypothetical protein n=1 Tax=Gimesia maris TaxID=122 RepID=UPI0011EF3F18|nr:hypothetical protein [Gimesia maris]QGQ29393.1 hypothetical protein F1729_12395 [Gimesia maris]